MAITWLNWLTRLVELQSKSTWGLLARVVTPDVMKASLVKRVGGRGGTGEGARRYGLVEGSESYRLAAGEAR